MSTWICADEKPSASHFYYFTKTVQIPSHASLTARISGDTRYQLYLNGQLVSEGPCQGASYVTYYETVDLTPYLREGENTLTAKVLYVVDGSFISVFRRSSPAFWMDGTLTCLGEETALSTDGSWTCQRDDRVTFIHHPGIHISMPPYEEVSPEAGLADVPVKEMYSPDMQNGCINLFGLVEPYRLAPRPIPPMQTFPPRPMKELRRGDGWMEFDTGAYTTAKLSVAFRAAKGSRVRLIYSESYLVPDGDTYVKVKRDENENDKRIVTGTFDSLEASGDEQTFSPFWFRAFRFLRVEFEDTEGFSLESLTYSPYFYPLSDEGRFTCSDDRINRMWDISRQTVLCCMHEMYVDCPYYEQQQYDMDSALEMLFTFRMSRDSRMPYKSLSDMAASQLPDGMLQANYPSTMVQLITGYTLFWILMLRDYLRYTGSSPEEIAKVRYWTGTVDKALEFFESVKDENGLISATHFWPFVDWVPSWPIGVPVGGREEPITATCLLYAAALKAAAEIGEATGRPGLSADYRVRADEMIAAVNAHCYDEEAGLYRDTPSKKLYSQHTTIWAILSGAVTGKEAGALIDRTFDNHVPTAVSSFSMNHYLFRALELGERYGLADRLFGDWIKMMEEWHCTTWCENPDSPRSECHGWSSAPTYELSAMILGVYPTGNGYSSVRIRPEVHCLHLDWAEGTVPTPFGVIAVSWKKTAEKWDLTVTLPENAPIQAEVILPDGTTCRMSGTKERFSCSL